MIRLIPMTECEFEAYLAWDIATYAEVMAKAGYYRQEARLRSLEFKYGQAAVNKGQNSE